MSCHDMPCHVMSCHGSWHVMWCHVMTCPVMSCHVMGHVMSWHEMTCHESCHVMSWHALSCHVMSCHVMGILQREHATWNAETKNQPVGRLTHSCQQLLKPAFVWISLHSFLTIRWLMDWCVWLTIVSIMSTICRENTPPGMRKRKISPGGDLPTHASSYWNLHSFELLYAVSTIRRIMDWCVWLTIVSIMSTILQWEHAT